MHSGAALNAQFSAREQGPPTTGHRQGMTNRRSHLASAPEPIDPAALLLARYLEMDAFVAYANIDSKPGPYETATRFFADLDATESASDLRE